MKGRDFNMSMFGDTPNTTGNVDTGIISYNPINGEEAGKIAIREVDKLKERILNQPLLVFGFSYKRIRMQLAWRMFAYPGDVPLPPELTDDFVVQHDNFNEVEFGAAMNNLEKAKKMSGDLETYSQQLTLRKAALDKFIADSEVIVADILEDKDEGQPDKVRLENELPVYTVQHTGAQMAEAPTGMRINIGGGINK